jgi:hypothetical protein
MFSNSYLQHQLQPKEIDPHNDLSELQNETRKTKCKLTALSRRNEFVPSHYTVSEA